MNHGDRYRIHSDSGSSGSMNIVYKSIDTAQEDRMVAIKTYADKKYFLQEEKILNKLKSKYICNILDSIQGNNFPWGPAIVIEYCEVEMENYVKLNWSSIGQWKLWAILQDICEGLKACQKEKIVHCDIKPKNIMLHRSDINIEGNWKLIDFDLARKVGESIDIDVLSPDFCAPEIAQRHRDKKSVAATFALDMFGLGHVLYFLQTNRTYWPHNINATEKWHTLASEQLNVELVQDEIMAEMIEGLFKRDPKARMTLERIQQHDDFSYEKNRRVVAAEREYAGRVDYVYDRKKPENISTPQSFIRDDITQQLKEFRNQVLQLDGSKVPRLFVIYPLAPSWKEPNTWLHKSFRLFFLCECTSERQHISDHKGYVVREPKKFIKKYGKYVKAAIHLLALGLMVAGYPIPDVVPKTITNMLQTTQDTFLSDLKSVADNIDRWLGGIDVELTVDGIPVEEYLTGTNAASIDYRAIDEPSLRLLDSFLKDVGENEKRGNLIKGIHTLSKNVVWVCERHRDELEDINNEPVTRSNIRTRSSNSDISVKPSAELLDGQRALHNLTNRTTKLVRSIHSKCTGPGIKRKYGKRILDNVTSSQKDIMTRFEHLSNNGDYDVPSRNRFCYALESYIKVLELLDNFVARFSKSSPWNVLALLRDANELKRLTAMYEMRIKDVVSAAVVGHQTNSNTGSKESKQQAADIYVQRIADEITEVAEHYVNGRIDKQGICATIPRDKIVDVDDFIPTSTTLTKRSYNGKDVAEKVIGTSDRRLLKRIEREVAILTQLSNEYIIKVYGRYDGNSEVYIILEWAEYGDLNTFMQKKAYDWNIVPLEKKVLIAKQVASGISYLHDMHILHENIRSHYVLLASDMHPKLTGFQHSRDEGGISVSISASSHNMRVHWLAPEILEDPLQTFTIACDIYSLALLLWEITEGNGRKPFETYSESKLRVYVVEHNHRVALNIDPRLDRYNNLITSAWDRDPKLRPNASQMVKDLKEICDSFNKTGEAPNEGSEKLKDPSHNSFLDETISITDFDNDLLAAEPLKVGIQYHKDKRYKEAEPIFRHHAQNQDPIALYWLGYYNLSGKTGHKKPEEAAHYFEEAAKLNNSKACVWYADCLLKGIGVDPNPEKALQYLERATTRSQPDADAFYKLHRVYKDGNQEYGLEPNLEMSEKYRKELVNMATKGDSNAKAWCKKLEPNA